MEGQDALMNGGNLPESPYLFSTVKIIFADNSIYWVPVHRLERYPRFRLSYNRDRDAVKLNWLNETQTADFMNYLRNGKWENQKPEDWDGPLDYYNRMQRCLSIHGLALDYGMFELARLTFGEFTSMAGRLSMFNVLEMLQVVNLTLQSNQTVSADHLTERELVAMGEEAIMAEHIASFKRLSLVEHSPTPTNITQAEVSEMMHKLQQYQERFGSLNYGDSVKAEVASSE
ncbi:uncharacterized protein FFUJ_05756 [Fusarium fujikuroi IMI 58289]|uniref:Uncharacterized protein n=2 Tax=Fusarium fujikuroi TaxID=5127 RepID=S0E7T2_GIBF5|nr:uncharacterized protein FFUJ_05756 [Fusarium fujikuroi IMI 58289]KLO84461.1 uncharacterized protein LW93_1260 [Fusarium fujikuroi]KLP11348.1 uncharacterized protein Y057_10887 [Fusarium fujikuroi]QGI65676.1 hypothetical protein CEK27_009647 [Fusarium fujikuroi]QGI96557.1 hypothetical protein CEK26_009626 [Fusarium fujikuroi]CCT69837.1 uncharacterized protein FFUJ_05756 [Fusarium fujikuroi IMI 58289]